MTSPLLEAVALACERDLRLLFEQLDLRLSGGDMVQVSGPNGSGKTSLLRLLAGLMQPHGRRGAAQRQGVERTT